MQSTTYTDKFGRRIAPLDYQPGDPKIVLPEPTIDTDADGLINVMEDGGVNWYVMNAASGFPLFLAFEFREDVKLDALDAAQRLKRRFERDPQFRRQLTEHALLVGSAFHGFGTTGAKWDVE